MKLKFWALLLLVGLLFAFPACSKEEPAGSSGGEKQVMYQIVNTANEEWVLDKTAYGSDEYRGETDAIHAEDFRVGVGEHMEFLLDLSENAIKTSEALTELTEDTYEYRIQLIAGGTMPTDLDEQYVYDPFILVEDFIFQGTYNEMVTIEWNGTNFKQVN